MSGAISFYAQGLTDKIHQGGGACFDKMYVISAVVLIVLAGLTIVLCFNIEFPPSMVKLFKEIPMMALGLFALTGIVITVWAVSGIREKRGEINLKKHVFTHVIAVTAETLLGENPSRGYRIGAVVGPLFLILAILAIVSLNMPQMVSFHLPAKIIVAIGVMAIATRLILLRINSRRIEEKIALYAEKRHIQQLAVLLHGEMRTRVNQVYIEMEGDVKKLKIDTDSRQKRLKLLQESKQRAFDKIKRVCDDIEKATNMDEIRRGNRFKREFADAFLLERSSLAAATQVVRKLNVDDFCKLVDEFKKKKHDLLHNQAAFEQECKRDCAGMKEWINSTFTALVDFYELLPENPDKQDRSLFQLEYSILMLESLIEQGKALEESDDYDVNEQATIYEAIRIQLSAFEAALREQLQKPHIASILPQDH